MPNDLSNEFHADLRAAKADFVRILNNIQDGGATFLADVKAALTTVADEAGPVLVAAAAAGVNAALSGATGGLSGIATAAEGAALNVLENQGLVIADKGLQQLKTLVLGNVLKLTNNPAQDSGALPNGSQVTGG